MKTKILILSAAIVLGAFDICAQRDNRYFEDEVVTVILNEETDASQVEKAFKDNEPTGTTDNGLPRFAVVGKDHQFYLGLGAQFLGEAVFDWGGVVSSPEMFIPSAITRPKPGNGGALGFGWQTSSIYMNFVAMPNTDNHIGVFFKGNFTGSNNGFSCYHFYAKYRGLTVGYTNSAFTDGSAEPVTIDFQGPNGYPFITLFTAYWQQQFTPHISATIGIDAPTASFTTDKDCERVSQRIPAVPLYIQYGWNEGNSHVRLSGIIRPMQYRNLIAEKNQTLTGLGIQLSGMTEIAGPLTLHFNAAYGRGIGNYIQDDYGMGLDAVCTATPGDMELVKTLGLTAGMSCHFSNKVSSNICYSHAANFTGTEGRPDNSLYRYGDYVAANVIYNINKFLSAGIEYDYGHCKSFGGESNHANRLQCQFAVTF